MDNDKNNEVKWYRKKMVYVANAHLLLAYRIIISLYASFRIYSQKIIANYSINIFCVCIFTGMEQI